MTGQNPPGARIKEEFTVSAVSVMVVEIEHAVKGSRYRVERAIANPAQPPVVLDEPKNGGLIGH